MVINSQDGLILNIYKPAGMTSFDVVRIVRNKLKVKKVGHCGTLDPMAEGVLIILVGKATKSAAKLSALDKEYLATILLGRETDTYDITGKVMQEKEIPFFRQDELKSILDKFRGEIEQLPPMYSALKIKGRKLYQLARKGLEVERQIRKVQIYQLNLLNWYRPRLDLMIHCSKGTYIRTLAYDLGRELNCGACVEKLLRIKVGDFKIEDALRIDDI